MHNSTFSGNSAGASGGAIYHDGDDAACAAVPVNGLDQRAVIRPVGPSCDSGAVEVNYLSWRQWLPVVLAQ